MRIALGAILAMTAGGAAAAEQTLIVLDASGSMWGQIEGRAKLEIARDTLAQALAAMPADSSIGLMAYGHRRKGDCGDIELVVPPAPGSAATINRAVAEMKFLGMTPLTESVRQAAQALRYTEQAARVILITDGVETCNADPCALGEELAMSGTDFTAHVVGFGLSAEEGRQVACLAENTGGRYLQADDMAALGAALTQTMVEEPALPPLPEAGLVAPQSAAVSSVLTMQWQGPGGLRDDVQLFDPAAANGEGRVVRHQRLNQDRGFSAHSVSLTMAAEPGQYELRYWHGERARVLARVPIQLVPAETALEAPAQAPIGTPITIQWNGPGAVRDDVQLFDAASGTILRRQRLNQDKGFDARTVTLLAPAEPGRYLLRYWNGENEAVLAQRDIEIVPMQVTLDAPSQVDMARPFVVRWQGPGAVRDDVEIVDPADNKQLRRQRLNQDRGFDRHEVTLTAPAVPGQYQLRYYSGTDSRALATRDITVVAIPVALAAPAQVAAGSAVLVRWQGPGAVRDDVQIVDSAGTDVLRRQRLNQDRGFGQNEVTLKAPDVPGQYRLRYWNGESSSVLAEQAIVVQ